MNLLSDRMENFWDQRYSEPGFVYGREPNEFFRQVVDGLEPGKVLLPGEGEGRNAIYAAGLGWEVSAFDQSGVARQKALKWAESLGLHINYSLMDVNRFICDARKYDLVALVYVHLPPQTRQTVHRNFASCLNPGGTIMLECYHKSQLNYNTGGPRVEEMLYREEDLMEDFSHLEILQCERRIRDINEGEYHDGKSSIIRFIAKNPYQ